jgi:hypothetical protein
MTASKLLSAAALCLLAAAGAHADPYDYVPAGPAAAQLTRSDVGAQAATAALGTNAYRQSAMSGVVPARVSGLDRATVRNQVTTTARAPSQGLRISSFGNRQLPAGDSATF